MEAKVVVHMKDRRIHKGVTQDFDPASEHFYLLPAEGGGVPVRIRVDDMKALFYVKDYFGNAAFVARRDFEEAREKERRLVVRFSDGEEIWGTTGGGELDTGTGFYLYPADPRDNNLQVFVVRSSLSGVREVS